MIFFKIFSIIISLVVITKTTYDFKKKNESLVMFLFWLITWIAVIVIALFPYLIEKINLLIGGAGSGINSFIGAAFIFMFFIVYRIYTKTNRLENQLHQMVLNIGLRDIKEE
jgi:hypothetical protein